MYVVGLYRKKNKEHVTSSSPCHILQRTKQKITS